MPPSFQAARNLFRSSFPWLLRYAVYGKHRPTFPAIRCFPFPAVKHSPSYRQRKRSRASLGMTIREECVSHTLFLCMMHEISIPYTVISSAVEKSALHSVLPCPFRGRLPILLCHTYDAIPVCKKDRGLRSGWRCVNGVFQTYPLYATWNKPIPPIPSFRAQREIFLALCSFLLLSQKVSPFPLSHIRRYTGMQERSLGFARDDDTGIALSQHILYTMRRISPYDAKEKSPGKSRSFFVS